METRKPLLEADLNSNKKIWEANFFGLKIQPFPYPILNDAKVLHVPEELTDVKTRQPRCYENGFSTKNSNLLMPLTA